jgi:hypothetical protein
MTKVMKKAIVNGAVVLAVAVVSYAAGAAKAKPELVRIPAGELHWEPYAPGVPLQVAALWGDRTKAGDYGMLLKFPAGFDSGMHAHTLDYRAVGVQGTWVHTQEGETAAPDLGPGSFVMQPGKQFHSDACKGKQECIVFIHQHGKGDYIPAKPAAAAPAPAKK